jgi:heme-degrading monooxygenase HmoA
MIARVWQGSTRPGRDGDAYLTFVTAEVLASLPEIPGFRGSLVLRRDTERTSAFTVTTWWDDMDAIHAFAGDDAERAVVEAEARALLVTFDERVTHHHVAHAAFPSPPQPVAP